MKRTKNPIRKHEGAVTLTQMKSVMKSMLTEIKDEIKIDINGIKGDIIGIKDDIIGIKGDICHIKNDIEEMKGEQVRMNDKILDLYGIMHQDFAKKEDLKKLETRVEILETV